jgi:ATP-dependent DNA helicase RecQ
MEERPQVYLKHYFGYDTFRPGQKETIEAILQGRDCLAVMPTGAGKSLCYQLPALLLPGLTIVVSPLISLMKDQVEALTGAGIAAGCLNSSLTPKDYGRLMHRLEAHEIKLLYLAPERLEHTETLMQGLGSPDEVPLVVVDEAHCVSQWGHDFRPSYQLLPVFIKELEEAQGKRPVTGAFTATATEAVQDDISEQLDLRHPFRIVTGFNRPNLYFGVERVHGKREKTGALLAILAKHKNESGIIYCATRRAVDEVCETLAMQGYKATRYHAGLGDEERRRNQEDFISDLKPVMVATNAFGMGIDKANVSFVLHYNMPKNIESYYQEAGRAGRDGKAADCILLYSPQDVRINTYLITHGGDEGEKDPRQVARNLELLKQMTFYATTRDCLRSRLLRYFGEKIEGRDASLGAGHGAGGDANYCGNCSNCKMEYEKSDVTVDAQKIISCVYRIAAIHRQCGKVMVCDVLLGKDSRKMRDWGFNRLSTFALMAGSNTHHIRAVMDSLISDRYLVVEGSKYPLLRLGPRYRESFAGSFNYTMMLPCKNY